MILATKDFKVRKVFVSPMILNKESSKDDFVRIGIYDSDYEYLNLEELRNLRNFLNQTIMKMTFKTTTK